MYLTAYRLLIVVIKERFINKRGSEEYMSKILTAASILGLACGIGWVYHHSDKLEDRVLKQQSAFAKHYSERKAGDDNYILVRNFSVGYDKKKRRISVKKGNRMHLPAFLRNLRLGNRNYISIDQNSVSGELIKEIAKGNITSDDIVAAVRSVSSPKYFGPTLSPEERKDMASKGYTFNEESETRLKFRKLALKQRKIALEERRIKLLEEGVDVDSLDPKAAAKRKAALVKARAQRNAAIEKAVKVLADKRKVNLAKRKADGLAKRNAARNLALLRAQLASSNRQLAISKGNIANLVRALGARRGAGPTVPNRPTASSPGTLSRAELAKQKKAMLKQIEDAMKFSGKNSKKTVLVSKTGRVPPAKRSSLTRRRAPARKGARRAPPTRKTPSPTRIPPKRKGVLQTQLVDEKYLRKHHYKRVNFFSKFIDNGLSYEHSGLYFSGNYRLASAFRKKIDSLLVAKLLASKPKKPKPGELARFLKEQKQNFTDGNLYRFKNIFFYYNGKKIISEYQLGNFYKNKKLYVLFHFTPQESKDALESHNLLVHKYGSIFLIPGVDRPKKGKKGVLEMIEYNEFRRKIGRKMKYWNKYNSDWKKREKRFNKLYQIN